MRRATLRATDPVAYWSSPGSDSQVQPMPQVWRDAVIELAKEPVLDYGCGFGDLAPAFADYCGVDIAEHRISRAREIHTGKTFARPGDDIGSFASVVCNTVLLHIPDEEIGGVISRLCSSAPRVVVAEHMAHRWREHGDDWQRDFAEYDAMFNLCGFTLDDRQEIMNPRYGECITVAAWEKR